MPNQNKVFYIYIHREETGKSILKQIKSESKLYLKRNRNAEVIFQAKCSWNHRSYKRVRMGESCGTNFVKFVLTITIAVQLFNGRL
jgi:hypothetical protein